MFIREYRPEDFDALTILWRVAREKSLPDFQRRKGHFFYEDQDYFRAHILQENQFCGGDNNRRAILPMGSDFVQYIYIPIFKMRHRKSSLIVPRLSPYMCSCTHYRYYVDLYERTDAKIPGSVRRPK
jgi:hypothetical protein